jgi:hypothetical protein
MGMEIAEDGDFEPLWCTKPDMSTHCTELLRCMCKTECKNCRCKRNKLACTQLCGCDGKCASMIAIENEEESLEKDESDCELKL